MVTTIQKYLALMDIRIKAGEKDVKRGDGAKWAIPGYQLVASFPGIPGTSLPKHSQGPIQKYNLYPQLQQLKLHLLHIA